LRNNKIAMTGEVARGTAPDLTAGDLGRYWNKLGSSMTVDEVSDWVSYGSTLADELGVKSTLQRKQILRAISMRLLGVADGMHHPPLFHQSMLYYANVCL
jgi:hypothetical protein